MLLTIANVFCDKMLTVANYFQNWLNEELKNRGWSQADLARAAGVTRSAISLLLSESRNPGTDACTAIAKAFKIPPEEVFRAAGILPAQPDEVQELSELKHLFAQLPPYERQEVIHLLRFKLERIEKDQMLADLRKQYEQIDPNDKQELFGLVEKFLAEHGYKKR